MPQTYIQDLSKHVGETVTIKGWLYNARSKGKLHFLLLRDGTGIVQAVAFKGEVPDDVFERCGKVPNESSVIVEGAVRADERAPGGHELSLKNLTLVCEAKDYPIQIQKDQPDVGWLMEKRHLWLRSKKQASVLRVRATIIKAIRDFFDDRGFTCTDSPILTPAACEGTSTLFGMQYFDEGMAYLTQSGQLYAEACAMALGKVYCFGPTFRAEKSKTRKHLTEFWMVEPEVAFMELEGLMELAEQFVSFIVQRCLETRQEDLKVLERNVKKLETVKAPFPRISYDEAVGVLSKKGHAFEWGNDFGAPEEQAVGEDYDRPVMVHHYPVEVKAFYMQPEADGRTARCVDVIAPEGYGEIIGGSQRIHDLALLEKRMEEHNLPKGPYEWYLDLRRYGSVPHSGFGLGVERTVSWIAGIEHIREAIPFPRMLYKIYP